jgi:hypothetical protein
MDFALGIGGNADHNSGKAERAVIRAFRSLGKLEQEDRIDESYGDRL